MRTSYIITGLLSLSIFASCARKNDPIDPTPRDVGGKGGNATLRITPRLHGRAVDSCTISIKYDATTDVNTFDDSMNVSGATGGAAVFEGLTKGDYFFSGVGYDFVVDTPIHGSGTIRITDTSIRTYDINLDVNY